MGQKNDGLATIAEGRHYCYNVGEDGGTGGVGTTQGQIPEPKELQHEK